MKLIIVGLGNQGQKRKVLLREQVVATVDPFNSEADYKGLHEVPAALFDAALLCVPDEQKPVLMMSLVEMGKHVLVEKPLLMPLESFQQLNQLAAEKNAYCYTAYNHRFEPAIVQLKQLLESGRLGKLYHCRMFYGNGTARDVRQSRWRDAGAGVVFDLGSHLLDLVDFLFEQRFERFELDLCRNIENHAPDHAIFSGQSMGLSVQLEVSLLSWRNSFYCDIYAEHGSVHLDSLCKWGPASMTIRERRYPSGRPKEDIQTLVQPDPTWELEHQYFIACIKQQKASNFTKDQWIHQQLESLNEQRND